MARSANRDPSITPSNDKRCIKVRRGNKNRPKTQSNKTDRQLLQKDLVQSMREYGFAPELWGFRD